VSLRFLDTLIGCGISGAKGLPRRMLVLAAIKQIGSYNSRNSFDIARLRSQLDLLKADDER
jgi:hypothetical protein